MFEKIFNRIYGKVNNYYLSLIISAVLFPIYNLLFRLRIILMRNGRKITLTEEESKMLIDDKRRHQTCQLQLTNDQLLSSREQKNDNRPLNLGRQTEGRCCSSGEIVDNRPHESQPLLSIMVPAYNVEKYIEECINSILSQETRYTFEVIVINDGSTDGTFSRLKQYEKDKRVNIISEENCGISGARNKGLNNAKGQYYMFVDSDDRLSPGAIEALLSEIIKDQADIVEGNFSYFGDGISKYKGRPLWKRKRTTDLRNDPDAIMNMKGFLWPKVYSKKLWEDVRFPEGYIFEDTISKFIIYRRAGKYVYLPRECYEYRQHNTSVTKASLGSANSMDSFYVLSIMLEESKRLTTGIDSLVYSLILAHMGSLLYRRTKALEDKITDAMLVQCRSLLFTIEEYCPDKLSFYEKTLKNSIINLDKDKWILCCRMN